MSGWNGGYVTDIEYTRAYYIQQSPQVMAVACALNGFAVDLPWDQPDYHYLELGCGRGVTACLLAAANPGWRVTAIDFAPAAIADARRMASAAGLDNIAFIEADLAVFDRTAEAAALPPADAVSLHGVWSWVDPGVRAGIVRLLAAKVRSGGMVHLSYNTLPAMQDALGMQRVLREAGLRLAGRSDRQAIAGLDVVQALSDADAACLARSGLVRELLGRRGALPVAYLAHEYMNGFWQPQFHGDVARDLAGAKLDYAGAVRLHENFPDLMLSPAQRAIYDRFDDPMMRELILDTCTLRTLRHDVFIRGAARMDAARQDVLLRSIPLVLAQPAEDFTFKVEVPVGEATLDEAVYGPVVAALAERPHRIGELLALPNLPVQRENPAEMLAMLATSARALIAPNPARGASARVRRFNAVMARRDVRLDGLNAASAMATEQLGAGYPCRAVELYLVDRIAAAGGAIDPAALAVEFGPDVTDDGRATLADIFASVLRDRLQVWHRLGVL